jgi:ABC-type multidrug transport system ATPase subunit
MKKIVNSENLEFQKINDTTFSVKIDKVNNLNKVLTHFSQNNIKIQSMTNETNRLEELFLSLTK